MQAVLADEMRAHPRQIAFVGPGEALEQKARDDQAEDRIAQEFEALVVVGPRTAMGQGAVQETSVGEAVPNALLQGGNAEFHGSMTKARRARGPGGPSPKSGPMSSRVE